MHQTYRLLASAGFPSFWKRSLDEFKRLSHIAIKLEALDKPKRSLEMWNFSDPSSTLTCRDMSDSDLGGYSSSKLQHVPQTATEPAHALFSGSISNKIPTGIDDKEVERTGYAAFRTEDRPPTMFGKSLWNVDVYKYLALRVKTDGRRYKVNLQTETIVYSDIHQHRLYARHPGSWETILIKWRDFVRTNHGLVVEPQSEILKEKVRTVGIGLTDRTPGDFKIGISRIWACNDLTQAEIEENEEPEERLLPKHFLGVDAAQPSKERAVQ